MTERWKQWCWEIFCGWLNREGWWKKKRQREKWQLGFRGCNLGLESSMFYVTVFANEGERWKGWWCWERAEYAWGDRRSDVGQWSCASKTSWALGGCPWLTTTRQEMCRTGSWLWACGVFALSLCSSSVSMSFMLRIFKANMCSSFIVSTLVIQTCSGKVCGCITRGRCHIDRPHRSIAIASEKCRWECALIVNMWECICPGAYLGGDPWWWSCGASSRFRSSLFFLVHFLSVEVIASYISHGSYVISSFAFRGKLAFQRISFVFLYLPLVTEHCCMVLRFCPSNLVCNFIPFVLCHPPLPLLILVLFFGLSVSVM